MADHEIKQRAGTGRNQDYTCENDHPVPLYLIRRSAQAYLLASPAAPLSRNYDRLRCLFLTVRSEEVKKAEDINKA
jgi:hypothetical protein